MASLGACEHCKRTFAYELIHNGFNDSACAYCDSCGCTAVLSIWTKGPPGVTLDFGAISPEIEQYLSPCACGGRFLAGAAPRCPHCHHTLSPVLAAEYI